MDTGCRAVMGQPDIFGRRHMSKIAHALEIVNIQLAYRNRTGFVLQLFKPRTVSLCSIPLSGDSDMFFYPWYPALMLAVESNNVIDIRLRKIASGGVDAADEIRLMVSEKANAAIEAGSMLMRGENSIEVIAYYRKQVAANASRLS
jgi:hypothetical protein